MKFVLSVIKPDAVASMLDICETLDISFSVVLRGRGTATKGMMDLMGIQSKERRIVLSIVRDDAVKELIHSQRRTLYLDAPDNGIVVTIPVKSVGGGKALTYLNGEQERRGVPQIDYEHELVMAVVNEGHTDQVMDAAREAGATGGTILHGKGANAQKAAEFFKVSIAAEKEILFIVARTSQKAAIMSSILEKAGQSTKAGAIVFSLPVSDIAGFRLAEE